jgi:hypothetical protein
LACTLEGVLISFIFLMGHRVALRPLGGAGHKTASFPTPCMVFTLLAFIFFQSSLQLLALLQ